MMPADGNKPETQGADEALPVEEMPVEEMPVEEMPVEAQVIEVEEQDGQQVDDGIAAHDPQHEVGDAEPGMLSGEAVHRGVELFQ